MLDPAVHEPPVHDVPIRRAGAAALLAVGARLLAALAGVGVAGALSRELGPAGFGELSLAITVAVIASQLTDLGASNVAAAEMAADPLSRRELAAGIAMVRAATGVASGALGGVLLALVLDNDQAEWAGAAVVATVPLSGATALAVLAQARLRPDHGAVLALGHSALWLGCVLAAGAAGAPLAAYGVAFLGCGVAHAGAAWVLFTRGDRPDWSRWRPAARRLLARSWPLGVAAVMGVVYYRIDALFVFHFSGAREAGLYAAACRFIDVLQLAPLALSGVLVPMLARSWARQSRDSFEEVLRLGVVVAAVTGAFASCVAIVAGDGLATAVYGSAFDDSGDMVSVLGVAFFSISVGYVYSSILIAIGGVRIVAVVATIGVVVSVGAGLAVIPAHGGFGAAWVTVATEYLVSTTLAVWIGWHHRLVVPWGRVCRSAMAGAAMAAVAWPLRDLALPFLLAVCLPTYVAFALVLGAITAVDVRCLLDRRVMASAA